MKAEIPHKNFPILDHSFTVLYTNADFGRNFIANKRDEIMWNEKVLGKIWSSLLLKNEPFPLIVVAQRNSQCFEGQRTPVAGVRK